MPKHTGENEEEKTLQLDYSYKKITDKAKCKSDSPEIYWYDGNFVHVDFSSVKKAEADVEKKSTTRPPPINRLKALKSLSPAQGWKLHIAIDDGDGVNLARGWDILLPIFMQYKIKHAKVIMPNMHMSAHSKQCGKEVTVYMFENDIRSAGEWKKLIIDITKALAANKITPSPTNFSEMGEKEIQGSHYVSYRYDTGKRGRAYKPQHGAKDPFAGLSVQVEIEQPEKPAIKNITKKEKGTPLIFGGEGVLTRKFTRLNEQPVDAEEGESADSKPETPKRS